MAALVSSSGVPPIYHAYPPPLATYEDVVANPKLFMDTLEKLHITMKTKFMIPIIGGRDLDLHRLFVEVTSRGGIEKILREKRWKEVTAVFNFPSTATNASFILRKYYYQLLNHYEQIYFFKAKGWSPLPPGSIQTGAHSFPIVVHGVVKPALPPPSVLQAEAVPTHQHQHQHHQQGLEAADHSAAASLQSSSVSGASLSGTPVIGVIDGKFEGGYLVTVTVGSEKLKGVLYQSLAPATATAPAMVQNPAGLGLGIAGAKRSGEDAAPMAAGPPAVKRRRRRKKSEIRRRDPNHPKPNRSGYNFFFKEQHARLKPQYPGRDREISRMIGELWTNLNETDRAVYQEKARKDKERYRIEMEGYRERLKSGELAAAAVSSNPIPLRQRVPPEHLGAQMVDVVVKEGSVLSNTMTKPTPTGAADDQTYEEEDEDEEEDDEEEDEDEYDDDDYEGSSMSGGVGGGSGDQVGEVQEEVGHIDRGIKMNNNINPSAEDQRAEHQQQKQEEMGSTMIPSSTTATSSNSVLSVEAAGKRPAAAEESTRLG